MTFKALELALKLVRSLNPVLKVLRAHDPDLADQIARARTSGPLNLSEGRRRIGKDRFLLARGRQLVRGDPDRAPNGGGGGVRDDGPREGAPRVLRRAPRGDLDDDALTQRLPAPGPGGSGAGGTFDQVVSL